MKTSKIRVTRHNGRSGESGLYNPKHNDRSFNTENAEHIDDNRVEKNIYWDCFNEFTRSFRKPGKNGEDITFEDVERAYYAKQYDDYLVGQHERNVKSRHAKRDRSADDLLHDKRFCPEETIYQLGTKDYSVPVEQLITIFVEFVIALENHFGEHVHVIDWGLHLDEATPHIHERHVFDFINQYGEIQPGQEKALEALGIERPEPNKKPGRQNNRKMTFDKICREILFDICKTHGIEIEEEPEIGGRKHMEKQAYIQMKQKEKIAEQEVMLAQQAQNLESITLKLDDAEKLLDEVSQIAYDKAVENVTDSVRAETQEQDRKIITDYKKLCLDSEQHFAPNEKVLIRKILDHVCKLILQAAQKVLSRVQTYLKKPAVKEAAVQQIKEAARPSVLEKLKQNKAEIAKQEEKHFAPNKSYTMEH